MLPNSWFKKEKPLPTMIGMGGGATGLAGAGGAAVMEATGGTTNEPGNGYKYHLFTYPNSDNFVVDKVGSTGVIEVLVVGGGGGGGNGGGAGGGGGGAGGVRNFPITISAAATYPISVGDGGASLAYDGPKGPGTGGDSSFNSPGGNSVTQVFGSGGGAAGTYGEGPGLKKGGDGGSGGGQGNYPTGFSTPRAGTVASPDGRSPTVQGHLGGFGSPPANAGAGGGGAGAQGGDSQAIPGPDNSGTGGAGTPFPAFAYPLCWPAPLLPAFATPTNAVSGYVASPTSDHYGGGGGGSQGAGPTPIGFVDGGAGGGGSGVNRYGPANPPGNATQGVDGLGGGGGGTAAGNASNTGPGGNGVVIVRYAIA